MKLEDYKAGRYIRMEGYRSLILSKINYDWGWEDSNLNMLSAEASRLIGELNAYSLLLPNVDVYIKMLIRIEANKSNKIDGSKTSFEEEMLEKENVDEDKEDDWESARRYVEATNYGIDKIKNGSTVGTKLMKELHKLLMQGETQGKSSHGKVRTIQNWVGGDSIENAVYVPPPCTEIDECLMDFERFVDNENTHTPDIVKLAILHYQFETIHPFMGANGKIGRMIIPLYLQSKGMLDKSCLYMSEYFEKNKVRYFSELMKVRDNSNIIEWIKFFLEAVIETVKITKNRFDKLSKLYDEMDDIALDLPVKPENAYRVIEMLYREPVVDRTRLGELAGVKDGTMRTIINSLIDENVVEQVKGNDKSKVIVFQKYLNLFLDSPKENER